jgi:poly(A) polymerase
VLQPRFEQRVKERVFRLLSHPRFRAAYDFLLLRSSESPALMELAEWWTSAQTMDPQALAKVFVPQAPSTEDGSTVEGAPKKRRARRRRRKARPASEGSTPAE